MSRNGDAFSESSIDWWPFCRLVIIAAGYCVHGHFRYGWSPSLLLTEQVLRGVAILALLIAFLSVTLAGFLLWLFLLALLCVAELNNRLYDASVWVASRLSGLRSRPSLAAAGLAGEILAFVSLEHLVRHLVARG